MSVRVRAKMYCNENSEVEGQDGGRKVVLYPVIGGSMENDTYFKYTPGGICHLEILNEEAAAQFEVGKEYYVTFEPA